MTKERLEQIKEDIEWQNEIANKIYAGDRDNYDGADGARNVIKLCNICEELIAELETHIK